MSLANIFKDNIKIVTGNGNRIDFWRDNWGGGRELIREFPRLWSVALNRNGCVVEF